MKELARPSNKLMILLVRAVRITYMIRSPQPLADLEPWRFGPAPSKTQDTVTTADGSPDNIFSNAYEETYGLQVKRLVPTRIHRYDALRVWHD